jgi:hypothetical protein
MQKKYAKKVLRRSKKKYCEGLKKVLRRSKKKYCEGLKKSIAKV